MLFLFLSHDNMISLKIKIKLTNYHSLHLNYFHPLILEYYHFKGFIFEINYFVTIKHHFSLQFKYLFVLQSLSPLYHAQL